LKKLKLLSIQSNRITKLEGLEQLESLEELYISHNGITEIEGLEKVVWFIGCSECFCPLNHYNMITFLLVSKVNLTTLDLASNEISRVQNISHLNKLEEFWVCYS
jgi:protein phosphatase 1 regulatory subunit 7